MYSERRDHRQTTFLIFFLFIIFPCRSNPWLPPWRNGDHPLARYGRTPNNYWQKKCLKEEARCSYSSQCCDGFVCIQAGYSDGHCIRETSIQSCSKSSDCPPGCFCELMGLKVDGVTGYCVAKFNIPMVDMGREEQEPPGRIRSDLRTGIGLAYSPQSRHLSDGKSRESSLERTGDAGGERTRSRKLEEIINKLEDSFEWKRFPAGNRRGGVYSRPDYTLIDLDPSPVDQEKLLEVWGGQPSSPAYQMSNRSLYKKFCQWMESKDVDGGGIAKSSRAPKIHEDDSSYIDYGLQQSGRLGRSCESSQDCLQENLLPRLQVCCAEVSMARQGVKVVCEWITPLTKCID